MSAYEKANKVQGAGGTRGPEILEGRNRTREWGSKAWGKGWAGVGKQQGAGRTNGAIGTGSAYKNRMRNGEYLG